MKSKWLLGGAFVGISLGAGLSAQAQNPTPNTGADGSIIVVGCLKTGTTGTSGPVGTSGTTSGTAASNNASAPFMLVNARATATSGASTSPGATAGVATPSGTAGNSSAGGAAADGKAVMPGNATYVLEGKASELRPYVGQQVEIRGRYSSIQSGSSGGADTTGTTGSGAARAVAGTDRKSTDGTAIGGATSGSRDAESTAGTKDRSGGASGASSENQPRVDVESVRMLAANCA